jgi:redox-sensitive bicupin YhaK (pirin superfamily)
MDNQNGARGWTIPAALNKVNRTLYFYRGETLAIGDSALPPYHSAQINPYEELNITNGISDSYMLLLQGKPIDEPVVQYGPFVMNSEAEIQQAFNDYRRTEFGGWPWPRHDQVHPRSSGRFAKYDDGTEEIK